MEGEEINQVENLKIQSCSRIGESCIPIIQSCYIFDVHQRLANIAGAMAIRLGRLKNTTFFIVKQF